MKIGPRGLALIKRYEGCKLDAYQDSVGVWTIGYGSTLGVKQGQRITQQQADALLIEDLARFENGVGGYVTKDVKESQADAMISLAFNIGLGNFRDSTLLKLTNSNQPMQAAQQFPKWCNAGGKPLLGLLRRRLSEAQLYLEDL